MTPLADEIRTRPLPEARVRGVLFHAITEAECVRHILDEIGAGRGGWVVTANIDHLRRLLREPAYAALCANASLRVADGMPVVWASRLEGTPVPERVAGSDLIWSLTGDAAERGRSVFLLGGAPWTVAAAARTLEGRYPGLRIAGTACPQIGLAQDGAVLAQVGDALAAAAPDIVYVALGSPMEQQVIQALRERLPCAWWLGVGISFRFVAGELRRAPRWLQRIGLEWIHRMFQEPRRLAKRYLGDDLPFAVRLFGGLLLERLNGIVRPRSSGRASR